MFLKDPLDALRVSVIELFTSSVQIFRCFRRLVAALVPLSSTSSAAAFPKQVPIGIFIRHSGIAVFVVGTEYCHWIVRASEYPKPFVSIDVNHEEYVLLADWRANKLPLSWFQFLRSAKECRSVYGNVIWETGIALAGGGRISRFTWVYSGESKTRALQWNFGIRKF